VFLDVDKESGLMDLDLLDGFLAEASKEGYLPKAVISVDLFGSPTNYARLLSITDQYGIPVLCDSAEALGSKFGDMSVGACGAAAVFSFNGNKILSTSGGGALLSNDEIATSRVRKLSQQAREPVSWYQHNDVGFNYRLSNILAALGRSQLERIESLVSHRRWVRSMYQEILGALVDVSVVGDPPWGKSNAWLTVVRLRQGVVDVGELVERMNLCGIEVRHVWKPLHSQPVFHSCPVVLNGHADSWFTSSVCLPSGPCLTETDIQRICALLVENIA
jgi:dTDP-4-amino-4,6-dideoxygalactose transaminase